MSEKSTQDDLLERLDQAHNQTLALLQKTDTTAEIYPGWTFKNYLAHLAGWDEATTASLKAFLDQQQPGTPAYLGIDFYNQQSVETRQHLNYEQVFKEWELVRDEMKSVIRQIPADQFETPILTPWGQTAKIRQLVEVMIHHEGEHLEEIQKILELRQKSGGIL